jgi:hypothetical protein
MIKDFCLTLFTLVVLFVLLATIAQYGLSQPICYTRTKEIGLSARWSFWAGCQIEVEEGRWIPLENWYYVENPH